MAAGVHRLTLPPHRHSIGHVNIYALEDGPDLLLIDCGWSTRQARRDLTELIRQIGHQTEDIRKVLLTHCHSDHAGMAGWLHDLGAMIGAHQSDAAGTGRQLGAAVFGRRTAEWLAWAGAPAALHPEATRYALHQHELAWRGVPDFEIEDTSVISHGTFTLHAVSVPGHTPGSVAFLEASTGLLFTGDTLFGHSHFGPSVRTLGEGDPMTDYLESIERLATLSVTHALPGHNEPFTGVADRVATARSHHLERAEVVADLAKDELSTAWAIAECTPRRRKWEKLSVPQRIAATAEVAAHLARLASLGAVSSELAPRKIADRPPTP